MSDYLDPKKISETISSKLPIPKLPGVDGLLSSASALVPNGKSIPGLPTGKNPDNPLDALKSDDGWDPNVLLGIRQATYKATLFMTEDKPLNLGSYPNYAAAYKEVLSRKKTIVAETGVTGLNIQSIDMLTRAAPNANSRSMSFKTIDMVIKEPMGVNFMDMLAKTAAELKVKNYAKTFYFLEISFHGYAEDGSYSVNPCESFENGGKWLYQIHLNSIDSEFNYEGSVYTLKFNPYEEQLFDGDLALPFAVTPEARTVGDMMKNLSVSLNQAYDDMYIAGYREFEFKFQDFTFNGEKYEPSTFSLVDDDEKDHNPTYTWSMDNGSDVVKAHFSHGMLINDIIELTIANSRQAQNLAKGVNVKSELEKDKSPDIKEFVVFRVIPSVEVKDYDHVTSTYALKYVFTVVPYITQEPILSQQQVAISKDKDAQARNALSLRKRGFMAKCYDYLFTGKNDAVTNLDIKYNTVWSALLPRIAGFGNSAESKTPHAMYNEKTVDEISESKRHLVELRQKISDIETSKTLLDRTTAEEKKETDPTKKEKLASRVKELAAKLETFKDVSVDDLKKEASKLKGVIDTKATAFNTEAQKQLGTLDDKRSAKKYAEDVARDEKIQFNSALPVSVTQNNQDTKSNMGGPFPDYYNRDRSIYGAVMDQLYATQGGSLQKINMEIVGDPYWLGISGVERNVRALTLDKTNDNLTHKPVPPLSSKRPDFDGGDILFVLRFKYPHGYDDNTNNPIFKNHEVFTGVYKVVNINHKFENGIFRQTIDANRMPLIDAFKAFGWQPEETEQKKK